MEEKITCRICGHEVDNSLQTHINRYHRMIVAKYQKKFPGSPIFSEKLRDISRMVNKNRDQSYRKRLSENTKRLYQDPEWVKKHNDALRKAQNRSEAKKRHSEGAIRYFENRTPEQIEKRKRAVRKSWKDPQKRRNRVEGLKRAHNSEEVKRHHSAALKKFYRKLNKRQRKAIKENLRKIWAKPVLRKKILVLSKIGLEKAMSPEGRRNFALANLSPELRKKRSQTALKRMMKQPRISALNARFKKALINAGVKPKAEKKVGSFLVDFLFPKEKLVVEVDGDFWHANPAIYTNENDYVPVQKRVVNKDKVEARYCSQNGFTLLRFWEQDINKDINACINTVKEKLNELRR